MKTRQLMLAVPALGLCFGGLPAIAEEVAEIAALEDVTVTANKMEEDILKVPQSITVIDESDIEEKGLDSATEVLNQIPNTLGTQRAEINFRGLNVSTFTSNNPVVLYVDGVPIANRFGYDFSFVNVENIEVLRGPQGTLYGKDAIGAVVNVITRDPGDTWAGKVKTEYGSWNTWKASAYANGPIIVDKLSMGISGQYDRTDGWIKNEYPGMNEDVGRDEGHDLNGYLLFTPTERLRLRISASSLYFHGHSEKGKGLYNNHNLDDFDRDMLKHLRLDVEPNEKHEMNAQSLIASYDFDRFKLESITTHRVRTISDSIYDADFGDSPLWTGLVMLGEGELTTWAEELRLSSANTSGFRWVGGIYLEKEEDQMGPQYGQQFPFFDYMTMTYLGNFEMLADAKTDSNTRAIFGQAMIPFGKSFELTLGGRLQRIKREMYLEMHYQPVGMSLPPMLTLDLDDTWDTFLPKVGLSWFINDSWTAYASFSKGYMPGGFNYFSTGGGKQENSFEPEQSINYEMGIKADHDQWRINAAAFYLDIEDIHVYKTVGNMFLTDNADGAHSYGLELEGAWLPISGLELSASLSLMEAEYDDFDLGNNINLEGEFIEGAPNYGIHLNASYHHPNGLYGRVDLRHVGEVYYYDSGAYTMLKDDPYTVVNLRLGWLYENFDIFAYASNVTDEEYVNGYRANAMLSLAGFGDPRFLGVGMSYSF